MSVSQTLGAIQALVPRRWEFLVCCLMMFSGSVFAQFPDDYPNSPSLSPLLIGESNTFSGVIEIDIDRDGFRVESHPSSSILLQFNTNTIWDLDVQVFAPDGVTLLSQSTTAVSGGDSWAWTNTGVYGRFYIELGGYLEFTTGTYSVVVSQVGFEDLDGDGLNDFWEQDHFMDLDEDGTGDDDGDGMSDGNEYRTGTIPTNSASVFQVVQIQEAPISEVSLSPAYPQGQYRLSRAKDLPGIQTWVPGVTVLNTNAPGVLTLEDIPEMPPTNRYFYRAEFIY